MYSRIVSLVPSITELLFDLGIEESVVGITKFCLRPPRWRRQKMIVGGTKGIHPEKVLQLKPDLIIANKEENDKAQVEALSGSCELLLTDINTLVGALQMIEALGNKLARKAEATNMIENIQHTFSQLTTAIPRTKPEVLYLIWKNPYMTIGGDTFISDMMEEAGFVNQFKSAQRYPVVEMETLLALQPSLIFLSSEPFPFGAQHQQELQFLLPDAKIVLVDGEMFSWYGSRLLHAANYFQSLQNEINSK